MASPKINPAGSGYLGLAVLLLPFILVSLVILLLPFTRDQGIYAYTAWRWLAEEVPYRDTFDHKGPVLYALYAVGLQLSAGAMWGPNLLDLIARGATVLFVFLAARHLLSSRGAILAAAFSALPLAGIFNSCWWNAQAETFLMPLVAAAAWFILRRPDPLPVILRARRNVSLALAGFLLSQAIMLKPTAAFQTVPLLGWLLWAGENQLDERLRRLAVFLTALAAGLALWLIYFAAHGALRDFYEVFILFNSLHVSSSPALTAEKWHQLGRDFLRIFQFLPLLALLLPAFSRGQERRAPVLFLLGWLAMSLAAVAAQRRFFPYHWLAVVPALALAAGAAADFLLQKTEGFLGRRTAQVLASALFLPLLFLYGRSYYLIQKSYLTFDHLRGRISLAEYYARFNTADASGVGDFNLLASAAAATRLREEVAEGGKVLVFGFEPIVNYLAARPAPSRFEIDYPLTFTPLSEKGRQLREKWRAEFLEDLQAQPPEVVLLLDHDINPLEPEPSLRQAQQFTAFWRWLNQHYQPAEQIEDFHFYRKK